MPTHWTNIRLPVELHARLVRLANEFDRADDNDMIGRFPIKLPPEFADRGGTPLWFVIQKAVAELEQHRERSRYKHRKNVRKRKKEASGGLDASEGSPDPVR